MTLKQKTYSAAIWSGIDTFSKQGIHFFITLVLARILTPSDYGTIALLSIFFGIAGVVIESGLASALIQRAEVSDLDLSSVFYFNIGAAFVVSAIIALVSPAISSFYGVPVLTPLTRLMAVTLFIGSFGTVHSTLMSKSIDFRSQCLVSIAGVVVSGCIAIPMAAGGYGIWSLAVSALGATCTTTILYWRMNSWRPKFIFSLNAIRSLLGYGSFLLFSGLLDTLFARLNTLLIGKLYSPRDLGFYSRADSTQQLPTSILSRVISRVAFPVFCIVAQDRRALTSTLRHATTSTMMLNIPLMLGIAVTARPLTLVLYGEQWLASVPYLQVLCLGGLFFPLHVLNLKALNAQGHSNLFFRLEVIKKTVGIVILSIACFFGIQAIAWGAVLISVISFMINAHYSGRMLEYGTARQGLDCMPYFGASLFMMLTVWSLRFLSIQPPLLLLAMQVFAGVVIYCVVCLVFRLSAFIEVWRHLGSRLGALSFSKAG